MHVIPSGKRRWNHTQKAFNTLILQLSGEPRRNKILTAFSETEKSSLITLFRNAFAVLKRGKPWTDYEFLCELDIVKGLDVAKPT